MDNKIIFFLTAYMYISAVHITVSDTRRRLVPRMAEPDSCGNGDSFNWNSFSYGHGYHGQDRCAHYNLCDMMTSCCRSIHGSPTCYCRRGFTRYGHVCKDINECATGRHNCHGTNSICINTLGSFRCRCKTGYTQNGQTCTDINECTTRRHNCDRTGGFCTNTPGSFICRCRSGFTGNGVTCTDINECTPGRHRCDRTGGICKNRPGSYTCSCKSGYTGNGVTCTDINECSSGTHNCDKTNSICTNTQGSFTCTCKPGFYGDGRECTKDINECTSRVLKHDCDVNAKCTNTMGSYKCECNRVYFGDGKTCTRGTFNAKITINFKADFLVAYKNTTSALYIDFKSKIEIQLTDRCNKEFGVNKCRVDLLSLKPGSTVADIVVSFNFFPPSSDLAAFLKQVDDWLKSLPEGTNCTIKGIGDTVCAVKPLASDFDECNGLNVCTKPGTICNNTLGGYACICNAGFVGDDPENKGCTDLDECEELSVCAKPETICNNTVGGYSCTCKEGFVGDDPENQGCKDPDSSLPIIIGVTVPVIIVTVIVVVVVILLHRRNQACFAAKQQKEHDGTDLGAAKTNVKSGEDNVVYEAPMAVIASNSNEGYEDLRVKTGVRNSNVYETYEVFSYNSNDRAGGEVPMTPSPSAKQPKEHGVTDLGAVKTNLKCGEDNAGYEVPMSLINSTSNEGYEDLRVNSDVGNSDVDGIYEELKYDCNDRAGCEVPIKPCPSQNASESNYENVSYKMDGSPDTGLYANVQSLRT